MSALLPEDIGLKVSSSMRADFMMAPSLSRRQSEVLDVAVKMGYYDYPKKCNQSDIAEVVGISQGTVAEHLQLAESNIMNGWQRQLN
jgi:predicted DNA binding protein